MMNNPGGDDDLTENSKSREMVSRTKSRLQTKTDLSMSRGELSPTNRKETRVRMVSLEKFPVKDFDVNVSGSFDDNPTSFDPKIESQEGLSPETPKLANANINPGKKSSFGLKSEFVNLVN